MRTRLVLLPLLLAALAQPASAAAAAPKLTAASGAPATVSPSLPFGVKYTVKGAGTVTLTGKLGSVALRGSAKVKGKTGQAVRGTLRLELTKAMKNGSTPVLKLCAGRACRTVRTVTIRPRATGALPSPGRPVAGASASASAPAAAPSTTTTTTTTAPPAPAPAPAATPALDLSAPADPVTVDPAPDAARAVTRTIDTVGGTIEADGPRGEHYRLDVPYGALLAPTAITLTPLQAVAGLPFSGGLVAGAQLAPDGLRFSVPVRLTITGAPAVAPDRETGFGYRGDGHDLALAPLVRDAHVQAFDLMHFSAYGIASATAAERRAQLAHQTTGVEGRLQQLVGAELQADRAFQLTGQGRPADQATLDRAMLQYHDEVVVPLMAAALDDVDLAPRALNKYLAWERQLQLMWGDDFLKAQRDARHADFITILQHAAQHFYDRCLAGDPGALPMILAFSRQLQLIGADDDDHGTFTRCFRFELDLETTLDQDDPDSSPAQKFHGHLSIAKMVFSLQGGFQVVGDGLWTQDAFSIGPAGSSDVGCWLASDGFDTTGRSVGFLQLDVNWIEDVDGDELQLHDADIADVRLNLAPMLTREEVHWGYCGGSTGQGGERNWLGGTLTEMHADEVLPGTFGWTIRQWDRPVNAVFELTKDYHRTRLVDDYYKTTETTHVTLRHAPAP